MAKRTESQTAARGGRKGAKPQSANGHAQLANGKIAPRQASNGKGASRHGVNGKTAVRQVNGGASASRRQTNGRDQLRASAEGAIALTLTAAQVRQILHAAGDGEAELSSLLDGSLMMADGALALETWEGRYREELETGSASSSLLRGLLILACFPRDGTRRSVHWVAENTGMEMSTTHRYIRTLLLLGFLDQDPKTRAYGRVTA
jgi:IclR helix-turn-helix domain